VDSALRISREPSVYNSSVGVTGKITHDARERGHGFLRRLSRRVIFAVPGDRLFQIRVGGQSRERGARASAA
jgi:hypothetical protein